MSELTAQSAVGVATGEGFVILAWGAESGQLSPGEARGVALQIIEAADAAEHDAAALRVLSGMGIDRSACAGYLLAVREERGDAADRPMPQGGDRG